MEKERNQYKYAIEQVNVVGNWGSVLLGALGDRVEQASEISPPLRGETAGAMVLQLHASLAIPEGLNSSVSPAFSLRGKSPDVGVTHPMCGRIM